MISQHAEFDEGRKHPVAGADAILEHLMSRQHLRPHMPVKEVLDQTIQLFGCCPDAINRGIDWLGIDPDHAIGRLRRTELGQLSQAIHRFWMKNLNVATSEK